jgi:hypothetical protein
MLLFDFLDKFMAHPAVKKARTLANVYLSLHKEGTGEFMEFINELFEECGISIHNPKQRLTPRMLREILIQRVHPAEIKRFEHLLTKTDEQGKVISPMDSMYNLVERMIPMVVGNNATAGAAPVESKMPKPQPVARPQLTGDQRSLHMAMFERDPDAEDF